LKFLHLFKSWTAASAGFAKIQGYEDIKVSLSMNTRVIIDMVTGVGATLIRDIDVNFYSETFSKEDLIKLRKRKVDEVAKLDGRGSKNAARLRTKLIYDLTYNSCRGS
jgi:hypothetical protein